jgi:glycosyltransferase involved in cell wall biosynthesis
MAKGQIIYAGGFKVPDLDAGAVRVNAVSDALRAAGYEVRIIGDDYRGPSGMDRTRPLRDRWVTAITRGLDQHLLGRSVLRRIEQVDWRGVCAVIYYPGPAALLWQLIRICRKRRVRLIVDSTEWYDPSHSILGRFGPLAFDSEFRMRWLQARARNVICISSYLAQHFLKQGCNVIRVPPLIGNDPELGSNCASKRHAKGISLVYAGSPGRKELLREIISGVGAARRKGIDVSFRIVGISEADLQASVGLQGGEQRFLDGIVCHGRLPRRDAMRIVAESDYTVLLRPQERFANAGFPSKLVESLSLGIPVLANVTSDIAEFVRDGVEGFLLSSPTAAALEDAITRAVALTGEERDRMRANALSRARECFDYRLYASKLDAFISSARVFA